MTEKSDAEKAAITKAVMEATTWTAMTAQLVKSLKTAAIIDGTYTFNAVGAKACAELLESMAQNLDRAHDTLRALDALNAEREQRQTRQRLVERLAKWF